MSNYKRGMAQAERLGIGMDWYFFILFVNIPINIINCVFAILHAGSFWGILTVVALCYTFYCMLNFKPNTHIIVTVVSSISAFINVLSLSATDFLGILAIAIHIINIVYINKRRVLFISPSQKLTNEEESSQTYEAEETVTGSPSAPA